MDERLLERTNDNISTGSIGNPIMQAEKKPAKAGFFQMSGQK